jgi:TPP-dependent pyruvate/acetoin dehydrogenase alpha subunit
MPDNAILYRSLYRIRRFEETVLAEFTSGHFSGTTHTCLGQEANAVGVLSHLLTEDIVVSNHRSHGHFLAYGGDMHALFAELMGKPAGVCGGRGGSQHLQWRNFYSNGVLGGTLPLAAGMALAEKQLDTHAIVIVFLGDGALGEGVLYESLNIASLWNAPILYVLENNRLAQTTPVELNLAGSIEDRFKSFGIPVRKLDSSDVLEIAYAADESLAEVRTKVAARALILHTYRFGPHSKGDDTRPQEEISRLRNSLDPVAIQGARLASDIRSQIDAEVETEVFQAFQAARSDPHQYTTL